MEKGQKKSKRCIRLFFQQENTTSGCTGKKGNKIKVNVKN